MCSGCSGDYAGDFDESDDAVSEPNSGDGPAVWDRPDSDRNRLRDERAGGVEDGRNTQRSSSRTDLSGSRNEDGAEIYEILVSATHIVEIRVFAINAEGWGNVGKAEPAIAGPVKHSVGASAKYYQTRGE
jgi:hypothetical protein